MILLEKVEEGDSQGRAGPHLAITSTGVTEESLLEVHCELYCEIEMKLHSGK